MTTETIALNRYNSLFDNQQYSAIAERIAADLRVPRDSVRASDVMNEITNTALSLCNHNHYTDAWLRLATFCGQNAISIPTIDAIYTYLLIFQQVKDTRADDFEGTAKALLKSYESLDTLQAAVSCANYIREKLQSGLRKLTGALYEGIRGSDTPTLFNFKATYFPDEHDRR